MSQLKKFILFNLLLLILFPIINVMSYSYSFKYSTTTFNHLDENRSSISTFRPNRMDNFKEEFAQANFFGLNEYNSTHSNVLGNSNYWIYEGVVNDSSGVFYNSSILRINGSTSTGLAVRPIQDTPVNYGEFNTTGIMRTNSTQIRYNARESNFKFDTTIDITNINGRDLRDNWFWFEIWAKNSIPQRNIVYIRPLDDFSNVYSKSMSKTGSATNVYNVIYTSNSEMAYVEFSALSSNYLFAKDLGVGLINQTQLSNDNYNRFGCIEYYTPYNYGYNEFNLNLTSNNDINNYNITDEYYNPTYATFDSFNTTTDNVSLYLNDTFSNSISLNGIEFVNDVFAFHPYEFDSQFESYIFKLSNDSSFIGFDLIQPIHPTIFTGFYCHYDGSSNSIDFYDSLGLMDSFVAYSIDSVDLIIEFHNDSSYYNVYCPQYNVSYENKAITVNSSLWFTLSASNTGIRYYGGYNSSETVFNELNLGYYETSTIKQTSHSFNDFETARFYYFQMNCSSNVSTDLLNKFSGIITFTTDYNSTDYNFSIDDSFEINDLSNTSNPLFLVNSFSIGLFMEIEYYSSWENYSHNFSFSTLTVLLGYILEVNPSIFDMIISFVAPFTIFAMFPILFRRYSKKWYFILIGSIAGFFVMGTIGYLNVVEMIMLIATTLIGFLVVMKKGVNEYD